MHLKSNGSGVVKVRHLLPLRKLRARRRTNLMEKKPQDKIMARLKNSHNRKMVYQKRRSRLQKELEFGCRTPMMAAHWNSDTWMSSKMKKMSLANQLLLTVNNSGK